MKTVATQHTDAYNNTRQFAIDTARHLFSEQNYLGVSMRDIAKKLNVTKAALYYHFTGKEEIYKEVIEQVFNDLRNEIQEALTETTYNKKIHRLIENYLNFGLKENNLVKVMTVKLSPNNSAINELVVGLREKIADQIEPLMKELFLRKKVTQKVSPRLLTLLLTGMMDGLLLEHSVLGSEIKPGVMASQITTALSLE
ncbi:MAG: TetR/AcrR family transcriptional regulator [Candidatus Saccharimonadales bacterium]